MTVPGLLLHRHSLPAWKLVGGIRPKISIQTSTPRSMFDYALVRKPHAQRRDRNPKHTSVNNETINVGVFSGDVVYLMHLIFGPALLRKTKYQTRLVIDVRATGRSTTSNYRTSGWPRHPISHLAPSTAQKVMRKPSVKIPSSYIILSPRYLLFWIISS
jgi:hypothetical protein